MAKKLIFSCLMLLFPISILAQKSVLFDFSKNSKDKEIRVSPKTQLQAYSLKHTIS